MTIQPGGFGGDPSRPGDPRQFVGGLTSNPGFARGIGLSFVGLNQGQPLVDPFLRDFFGVGAEDFAAMDTGTIRSALNIRPGSPFDPQTGLPLRPARNLREAADFEFAQNLFVNRLASENRRLAAATLQTQLGLVQRGGAGSLQALLSPLFGQLANVLGTSTFQPFAFESGAVGGPSLPGGGFTGGAAFGAPPSAFGQFINAPPPQRGLFSSRSFGGFGDQPQQFGVQGNLGGQAAGQPANLGPLLGQDPSMLAPGQVSIGSPEREPFF